jgi:formate transporter
MFGINVKKLPPAKAEVSIFVNSNRNSNMPEAALKPIGIDSFMPGDMANKAEEIGAKKANMAFGQILMLSILAGAFIALGAIFSTIALTGASAAPWGWSRVMGGLTFTLGLILVVVGGAELFTGNNLIVMAWASRRITIWQMLKNWGIVYLGNFIGALSTALIVLIAQFYMTNNGGVGLTALNIALGKVNLGFAQAIALGMLCNALVCLAVWLTYSGRTTWDKIVSLALPVCAFVAAGFEHCIANMFFVPFAIFIKSWAPAGFWQAIGKTPADFANISWSNFLYHNLLPVTIGNIIGGAVLVGAVYWLVYLRKK